ncbi:FxSxx-COOH system tetratricopeptide repeat protein [Streptomyces sp. NPDC002680]|uniref:FxSxx-COOH system tetratricopeptide repeat protein n=1 Tax=Streptomyces sp. NPDC002680 TaxID=3364659 RepID=UPI0036AEAC25
MADRSGGAGSRGRHVIGCAQSNRPWAAWIAYQLERSGQRTVILRLDRPVGASPAEVLRGLLRESGRILLVLDDRYVGWGSRDQDEWTTVLREAVPAHESRFTAVSVATARIPPGVGWLRPVDLRGLDSEEARRRILVRLGLPTTGTGIGGGNAPRFPGDRPSTINVPHRNPWFTGRDRVLDELRVRLDAGGDGGARVALRGMSGVGKSQTAIEYAHRYAHDYDVVWWVNAGFRASAREQFADLVPRLGLSVGGELGEHVRAVHEALSAGVQRGRWLVIFDNADDMSQVRGLVPEGGGHVLVTTLTRDWAIDGDFSEVDVPPFDREESVDYVSRGAPRLTRREAGRLAEVVRDLPLLLAQTAAWLEANRMSVEEYVALIRQGGLNDFGIRISDDYPMGFQTSWSIALQTLERNHPEAAELLRLFAFFSPDAIPVRLIRTAHPSDLPERLSDLAADPVRWHAVMRRLSESTAVQPAYESSSDGAPPVETATMHRLYHSLLASTLSEDRRQALSGIACGVLAGADPRSPGDPREWPRYAELIPQLDGSGALNGGTPMVRELVLNCIEYLRARGEGHDGLALCEQAVPRWRIHLEPDDPSMLTLTHQKANMLRRVGRFREAEAVGRAVVDRLAGSREFDDRDLCGAKNGLGGTLMALGLYEEAHQLFEEAAQGKGADRQGLKELHNLAITLVLLGKYESAARRHREILEIRQRNLGPSHPRTLVSDLRYIWTLRLLGRYAEARARQERNLRLLRRAVGEWHPDTLLAEHNLALCLRRTGELEEAGTHLRSVVERTLRKRGSRHPDTLHIQTDHASFLREHGDLEQARDLADEVAEGYRDLLGPDHPFTIGAAANLGLVLRRCGEYEEALHIAETTLNGMTEAVGSDHPWTLGCAINLAGARSLVGDVERAGELSGEILGRVVRVLGDGHPMTRSCKAAHSADLTSLRHTKAVRHRERPYWDFEPQPT